MTLRQLLERLPDPLESAVRATARAGRELYYDVRDAMARPAGDPVFVLGNQKSGTTAIAALLGLATGEPATLDLRRETRHDFYRRITSGEVHFDRLVRRNALDFSRRIVKEPNLTLFYPQLRRRFPAARFAFVLRDPRDNIRSILDRVELPGDLQRLEPGRLAHVDPGFALVMDGTWCGITSGGHYVDKLAARWNACLDVYESDPATRTSGATRQAPSGAWRTSWDCAPSATSRTASTSSSSPGGTDPPAGRPSSAPRTWGGSSSSAARGWSGSATHSRSSPGRDRRGSPAARAARACCPPARARPAAIAVPARRGRR